MTGGERIPPEKAPVGVRPAFHRRPLGGHAPQTHWCPEDPGSDTAPNCVRHHHAVDTWSPTCASGPQAAPRASLSCLCAGVLSVVLRCPWTRCPSGRHSRLGARPVGHGSAGFPTPSGRFGRGLQARVGPCCSFPESPWKRSVLGRNRATDPELKGERLRGPLLGPLTSAAKPACPFDPKTINNPNGHTCRPLWAPPPRPCALRRRAVAGSAPQTTLRAPPRLRSA